MRKLSDLHNQNSFNRAYRDTENALGLLWYQIMLIIIGGISAYIGVLLTPAQSGVGTNAIYALIGVIAGPILLLGFTFLVMWLVAPYRQRNEARKESAEFQETIRQIRRELQDISGYQLVRIPELLSEMTDVVIEIVDKKKKEQIATDVLLKATIEILDIEEEDPLLNPKTYNNITKSKVESMIKHFRVRMGLKKRNVQKTEKWVRRIIHAMDNNQIGLNVQNNARYMELFDELKKHRTLVSGIVLDLSIENYLLHLQGLWDIRLMTIYSDTEKQMRLFPKYVKDFLQEMEVKVRGQMRRELIAVNVPLERWLGGITE